MGVGHLFPRTIIPCPDSKALAKAGLGALYIIGWEQDGDAAPLKVGIATDIYSRLGSIQGTNWKTLSVKELLFVPPDAPLREIEAAVHANLTSQGLLAVREWFHGGTEVIIETAKRIITAHYIEYVTCRSMLRRLRIVNSEAEIDRTDQAPVDRTIIALTALVKDSQRYDASLTRARTLRRVR